jgi:hypothetical protein
MQRATSMRFHLFILTDRGPVRIKDVVRRTRIHGNDRQEPLLLAADASTPIEREYREFVRIVVADRFGHDLFLVDLESDIHDGPSWRLPMLLAHELEHAKQFRAAVELVADDVRAGDTVVFATGFVDHTLRVKTVGKVPVKLEEASASFSRACALGARVLLVYPIGNAPEVGRVPDGVEALGVGHYRSVLEALPELAPRSTPRLPRWVAAIASAWPDPLARRTAALGAGALLVGALAAMSPWARLEPPVAPDAPEWTLVASYAATFDECWGELREQTLEWQGDRIEASFLPLLCALEIRVTDADADLTVVALSISPPMRLPLQELTGAWRIPAPLRRRRDRSLVILSSHGAPGQQQLDAWIERWLEAHGDRKTVPLDGLRKDLARTGWPVDLVRHTLEAY